MKKPDGNRRTAFLTLLRIEKDQAYSNLALNHEIEKNRPGDPAFVRELVYSVLRNRSYLDYMLNQMVQRGFRSLKAEPLSLLRMGLAQILYMDSVPDYAAINETVVLAGVYCRYQIGMVNGVLRNYLRNRNGLKRPEDLEDPLERLSVLWSCHSSIVALWIEKYGQEAAEKFLKSSHSVAPLMVRCNPLYGEAERVREELRALGVEAVQSALSPQMLHLTGKGLLGNKLYEKGAFSVQGTGSYLAVEALDPKPGERVIDVCAAPGGKSLAAAERMRNQGRLIAMDIHPGKLNGIHLQARRLGLDVIETLPHDGTGPVPEFLGSADRVICDVPCTGLGMLRRKPEIKYRPIEAEGQKLAEKQLRILMASAGYLKEGGRLLYSTCTVNPVENRDVVDRFLREDPGFAVCEEQQFFPDGNETDGFYYCILEKKERRKE